MKLDKITIENFRCFESLTVGFEEDVNVIVGINGSGKTALLDALKLALSNIEFPFVIPGYPYSSRGKSNQYREECTSAVSINDLHVSSKNPDIREAKILQLAVSFNNLTHPVSWQQIFMPTMAGGMSCEIQNTSDSAGNLSLSRESMQEILPLFAYYHAKRRFSETPGTDELFHFKIDPATAFSNALEAGADYRAMCQWFYIRENAELRELRERIVHKEIDFEYPDLRAVRNVLRRVIENVEKVYFDQSTPPRLKVDVNNNGKLECLALDQMSDGYRNLIAMVMDFARRLVCANPQVKSPLEETPGILLIDEIELHLHPKWQQTIIPNLRKAFPNTQLIVTTHSPQVLTTVDNRCIRLLKDNKAYTTDEFTKGAESKRILENILGTDSRPPGSEIKRNLEKIFDLIDGGELDEAEKRIKEIDYLKTYETSLLEAESLIACKRWEREEGI